MKLRLSLPLFCALGLLGTAAARAEAEATYGIVAENARWDIALGHHRARVQVEAAAPAVQVHLPWRLQLPQMERHAVIVVDPAGQRVANVVRTSCSREAADIVFQAAAPGEYAIYYLPFRPHLWWGGYGGDYTWFQETAEAGWRQQNGLAPEAVKAGDWKKLPAAKLVELQARSEFDRFDPMEVVATAEETTALLAKCPQPLLIFPEDRKFTIRMQNDLPLRWIKSGPQSEFSGEALRNEYYAFQIGAFAPKQPAKELKLACSALRTADGAEIPAAAFTCFNTQGVDTWGKPFARTVTVPAGKVQALWCGLDIAKDQKPGLYTGTLTIQAEGQAPQTVALKLAVADQGIADRGDGDLWRYARLRWLNSPVGLEETVVAPYTPLQVKGNAIACLGREVTLAPGGLPAQVGAGTEQVLAAPARLVVEGTAGALAFQSGAPSFTRQGAAKVAWEAASTAPEAALACQGEMEFDGHLHYTVTLTPKTALELKDLRLELPFRPEAAGYFMGAGILGGARPKEHLWKWTGPFDSFWLGSPTAGLQCELRGGSYHGPMLNLYHPAPPATWGNGGRGGVSVKETDGQVLATAFSGPRTLKAGEAVTFEFAFIVTPVKPLNTAAHFKTRYWHIEPEAPPKFSLPDPTPEALAAGVNVVNVHQASKRNPYINYPFRSNETISEFTQSMHEQGVKVKLYYTLRELSNYTAELWALRSFGDEVIRPGGGGGFPWMREHMVTGYRPAWYSPFPDGTADAAFETSGESRWYNYYVEGLGWMVKNLGIDGLYLDDVSYDRHILQRMRRIMERERPGCMVDLHSNTGFSIGPANQYLEFMPYVDRTWFGESFNYNAMSPDQWLVQTAGIPFGMMGDMLAHGGNQWRGALYGMTSRLRWQTEGVYSDPTNVWKVWDDFGIVDAKMVGYWDPACPVKTDQPNVLATAYVKKGKALVAIASWAPAKAKVKLAIDWQALGLDPAKARLHAPACERFQPAAEFAPGDAIPVAPFKGWMLILDENPPAPSTAATLRPLAALDFQKPLAESGWTLKASAKPDTKVESVEGALAITAAANHIGFVERPFPAEATAVDCEIDPGSDQGESWGPGIALAWANGKYLRFNIRSREQRFGIDLNSEQRFAGSAPRGLPQRLRIRLEEKQIFFEASDDGAIWETVDTADRASFPGAPATVRVGKVAVDGTATDYDTPSGAPGQFKLRSLRLLGK